MSDLFWQFKPEPRTFRVVASAPPFTITECVKFGDRTIWRFDMPVACGSINLMQKVFDNHRNNRHT